MKPMSPLMAGAVGLLVIAACDSTTEPPPPPPPPAPGTITGTILVEGEPLGGVGVNLAGPTPASTSSLTDGTFTFTSVLEGQYTVSITGLSNDVQFPQTTSVVTVVGGQTATVAFVGTFVRTASITGTVLVDGVGIEGATLALSGTESTTSSSGPTGEFSFPQLRAGMFTVELSGLAADLTFGVTQIQVTLGVGDAVTVDFVGIQEIPATVSIFALEDDRGFRLNANGVREELFVLVDVEPGTQTVTRVALFLNAEQVGEQGLAAPSAAFGQRLAPQRLRFPLNTTDFDATTGSPLFPNGPATLRAVVDTEQQGAGADENTLAITLDNRNLIGSVSFLGGVGGVVSGGHTWWGGGDLDFEVIPVIYDPSLSLSAIEVQALSQASPNGGPPLDFGSGPGQPHMVTGPGFTFTASLSLNTGTVEDDPGGPGHTVRVTRVFDGDSVDISSSVDRSASLMGLYVDHVGPTADATARILVDDNPVTNRWFSEGVLSLRGVNDFGVGGMVVTLDARSGGAVIQMGVTNVDELGERQRAYQLDVASLEDALGNIGNVSAVPTSTAFGVDRTPLTISAVAPSTDVLLNPADDAGNGSEGNQLGFTLTEPNLADGSPGSGYFNVTVIGTAGSGNNWDLSTVAVPRGLGSNLIDILGTLPDDSYEFTITTFDNATPSNTSTASFQFSIDNTAPAVTITKAPLAVVDTNNQSIAFTLAGSITDANGLLSALLRVRNGASDGNATCEADDFPFATTGPGSVNTNSVDVLDEASAISPRVFSFLRPTGGGQQVICLSFEASDTAVDVFGNSEPNTVFFPVRTFLQWN